MNSNLRRSERRDSVKIIIHDRSYKYLIIMWLSLESIVFSTFVCVAYLWNAKESWNQNNIKWDKNQSKANEIYPPPQKKIKKKI